MKHIRLLIACMVMALCTSMKAQTFHAIIFADTKDANIGKSTMLDLNSVSNMLVEAQSSLKGKMEFVYYIYPDKYCSPQNLRKVLDNLRCGSDDVVFFYYSGHGGRSMQDTSPYPQMSLGQHYEAQMISVEGVDRALARKNPRLRFVITDCCNSEDEFITPKLEISKGSSIVTTKKESNYEKLFMGKYGNVIITSSKAGETSSCNEQVGGFFTYCLLAVLENAIQQDVTDWNKIINATKNSTIEFSSDKMHPFGEVHVSATPLVATQPEPVAPAPVQEEIATQDVLLPDLLQLVNTSISAPKRLNMVTPLLQKHFANSNVIVEALGKDGRTVVNQETAQEFLERLSTSFFLVNFNILSVERNANQKIISLKVHEVYKQ